MEFKNRDEAPEILVVRVYRVPNKLRTAEKAAVKTSEANGKNWFLC